MWKDAYEATANLHRFSGWAIGEKIAADFHCVLGRFFGYLREIHGNLSCYLKYAKVNNGDPADGK
jgi:hypothetical protein